MKRTSLLLSLALLLAVAVAGCREKPQEKEKQKVLDPGAMLYILSLIHISEPTN